MQRIKIPNSLTALAHQHIKEYLLSGKLGSGERITEEYIAGQLGISKSPIREALNRLETEGLIRIEPRRGAFLRSFDTKDVRELYDLREALETHAVLTARLTPELLSRLKKSVKLLLQQHKNNEKSGYILRDIDFHSEIALATANTRLVQTLENLQDQLRILRLKTFDLSSDRGVHAHANILECLTNNDREGAVEVMREHIRSTCDELCAYINAHEEEAALAGA